MANDNRPPNILPKPGQQPNGNGGQQPQQQKPEEKKVNYGEPQPTPPQKPMGTAEWVTDSEKFLTDYGWTKAGYNAHGQSIWNDPYTQDYGPCEPVELKIKGKNKDGAESIETVRQVRGAPVPWAFELYRAVDIQRTRNQYAKTAGEFLTSKGWKVLDKNKYGRDMWQAPDEFDNRKMETVDAERLQKEYDLNLAEERRRIEYMRNRQNKRESQGARSAVV